MTCFCGAVCCIDVGCNPYCLETGQGPKFRDTSETEMAFVRTYVSGVPE